jgi:hypothetical protein
MVSSNPHLGSQPSDVSNLFMFRWLDSLSSDRNNTINEPTLNAAQASDLDWLNSSRYFNKEFQEKLLAIGDLERE